ncbi:MAG TPA: 30S ribosomal protein S1 [bacterium]|nr:30S ribosomal protein S1 [bacterium]HPJ71135.1 30S ribosomal protein S1 [bacterium]HPQ66051.1 30S ribosomal protein S1 [bacterium]
MSEQINETLLEEEAAETAAMLPTPEEMMTEEAFGEMVGQTMQHLDEGKIVKGRVYGLRSGCVVIDIGYKSEGLIPLSEFEGEYALQAGDEVEVLLERLEDNDGMVSISKFKADRLKQWNELMSNFAEGDTIEGIIVRQVKGGMMVDIGIEAFLPASQIDIRYVRDKDALIGQKHLFKIIKINDRRRNIVLSRRELLEEQRATARTKLLSEIKEGELRRGAVKNITDFGVFIDLGGLDGLLHITDMTWGRISHPSELLAVGDEVEVKILTFDRDRERVSLGLKQKSTNPWSKAADKYPVGSKSKGRVVNIMPYGAFVELEDGIEGLVHISELSWTRKINHPSDVLAIGDIVEVAILKVEPESEKISLGIKQLEFNPWSVVEEKYPVGTVVHGRIRNMTAYGAFIELEEGIDGLIHVSDMSWTRKINHPSQVLKRGDAVEAKVLAVDPENKKISLGLKQLMPDPWDEVEKAYAVGDTVSGKVTKVAGFGVFVELETGIEGLVHVSQVSNRPFEDIKEVISEGSTVKAQVTNVDKNERKISLSIKNLLEGKSVKDLESPPPSAQLDDTDTRLRDELERQFGSLGDMADSDS